MVGRKVRPAAHQPLNADQSNGGSKFRRKLSQGLSFSWNPLSQRKTTPARHPVGRPSVPGSGTSITVDAPLPCESDGLLSSTSASTSLNGSPQQRTTSNNEGTDKSIDPEATPKALPRSRTMSYIPRPSRSGSESSVIDSDSATKAPPPVFTVDQARATPSKIPTPSPPVPGRRQSSPRQYNPKLTTQQAKHVAAGNAFAGAGGSSPSKASVRSHTTPNLVKHADSPPLTNFMIPRKSMLQNPSTIPGPQRPTLKENMRSNQRDNRRLSQIQEKSPRSPRSPRRASLTSPRKVSNRRSIGPGNALAHSKQLDRATPTTAGKRLSSQIAPPTPLTAKRLATNKQSPSKSMTSFQNAQGNAIAQSRLMGPVNPPTPPQIDHAAARPALPRASTDKDLRRKTFTTPAKRSGVGMLSRSQGRASNEVRESHSSTFHNLLRLRDPPPPVPPIPERFRTPSMPVLTPVSYTPPSSPEKPRPQRVMHVEDPTYTRSKESNEEDDLTSASSTFALYNFGTKADKQSSLGHSANLEAALPTVEESSDEETGSKAPRSTTNSSPNPFLQSELLATVTPRSWSISDLHSEECTDTVPFEQVKDYMPPLYWAGRFQSRFDQWRTEAMKAELDKDYKAAGFAGQFKLSDEKEAACYIFLQLRDVCVSNQAADSLWVGQHRPLGKT